MAPAMRRGGGGAGRRRLAALLAAAGFAALAASAGGLRAGAAGVPPGPHAYTVSAHTYTVMDGPGRTHPETLDTDLYLPDNATAATPQPAMLITHGFGLSKSSTEMTSSASYLARHGYVVLVYSSSGFGASGGCIELDSLDWDVVDARGLIDQGLAPRADVLHDATGPVVGMMGGSYGGGIDLLTATADPRIRAIAPFRTWNTLQYSLAPDNLGAGLALAAPPTGVVKTEWMHLLFASGASQPAAGGGGCTSLPANASCPGFDPVLCQSLVTTDAAGAPDPATLALLARSSVASVIGGLRVPTLLVQGESDTLFNLDEAAATYGTLKAAGVPVHMIWHSGGHGGYNSAPGEGDFYAGDTTAPDGDFLPQQALAWFDHWLRGAGNDIGPEFQYFRDWVAPATTGSAAPSYAGAPQFPAQAAQVFTLSGGSGLVTGATAAAAGSATAVLPPGGVPPSYSETSNFQTTAPFSGIPASDPPGEAAAFTSAPFPRDTTSVGIPTAHLVLSHLNPAQDLILFAKVLDVAADGTATLVHRLAAPVRIPVAQAPSGQPVTLDIRLLGFAHLFPAGHAVRLDLATTDSAYTNGRLADSVTVTAGPGTSTFALPVDAAPATAGPGGAAPATAGPAAASPPAGTAGALLPTTAASPAGGAWAAAAAGALAVAAAAGTASARRRRRHPQPPGYG